MNTSKMYCLESKLCLILQKRPSVCFMSTNKIIQKRPSVCFMITNKMYHLDSKSCLIIQKRLLSTNDYLFVLIAINTYQKSLDSY